MQLTNPTYTAVLSLFYSVGKLEGDCHLSVDPDSIVFGIAPLLNLDVLHQQMQQVFINHNTMHSILCTALKNILAKQGK